MEMETAAIGFIGLGTMGSGMAKRLLQPGHRVVAFDLDGERLGALVAAGAQAGAGAADVAQRCDVVMTSLPSPQVFVEVAENDLVPAARPGQIVIDLGTSQPSDTRRLSALFAQRGAALLDAPVSGGAGGAAQGSLRIFVGGDAGVLDRCRPLLERLAEPGGLLHCGPSGAGQTVKAVNQLAMGLSAAVHIECLAYGTQLGIPPQTLCVAVGGADGWRAHFADIARRVAAGKGRSVGVKSGQLAQFLAESQAAGFPMPIAQAVHSACKDGPKLVTEANRLSASYWHQLVERAADPR